MTHLQKQIGEALRERDTYELCLGYVRYEFIRRMNPRRFQNLHGECLLTDKRFDDLVDELIEAEGKMNDR